MRKRRSETLHRQSTVLSGFDTLAARKIVNPQTFIISARNGRTSPKTANGLQLSSRCIYVNIIDIK